MEKFLIYQVESSICMLVLFSVWYFLMKKDTYFTLNRIVLLSILIISLLIPIISFNSAEPILNMPVFYIESALISAKDSYSVHFPYMNILGYISISVMLILAVRYTFKISQIFKLVRNSTRYNGNIFLLTTDDKYSAFSFFKWIFIPENISNIEREVIISHESSHINKWHFIDRTFLEIAGIVLWFNPVMLIYKSELKNIHEFEADRETLENCNSKGDYFELIYKYSTGICFSDISLNFNFSNLKERITMMTKNRSSVFAYFKQALLLPAVAFLLFNFSCNDSNSSIPSVKDANGSSVNTNSAKQEDSRQISESAAEVMPQYKGDLMSTLSSNLKYPKTAKEKGIQGKVVLALTISEKGKIDDIKVEGGVEKSLDEEAVRVAKYLENWEPAKKDGKPISAQVMIPIQFRLQ